MASADQDQLKAIFAQVDELFATGKSPEALPLLKPYSSRSDNAEVQWRLARLQYTIGKFFTKDQDVAKQLSVEALEAAKKAVAADERSCFAHKVPLLCLCVCVCVYVCVCVCVCMLCVCVCMCVRTCVHVCAYARASG